MTRIEFFNRDGQITGFSCSGHSGYAEAGQDVVCAIVSTAVQFAANTITDVLGVRAKVKVEDAKITLTLPAAYEETDAVQALLTGMMLTLCSARDQYPDYIEVMEV